MRSITPGCKHPGLGSSAFARRYLRNRCFFLFLRVLRCFSSPGSPPHAMDSRTDDCGPHSRVSPFRDLRIMGYVLLPEAFRSLSRLSSALSAKASALRPSLLDLARPRPFLAEKTAASRPRQRTRRSAACFRMRFSFFRFRLPRAGVLNRNLPLFWENLLVLTYILYRRTFRILDVVFSWNLIKKTFYYVQFSRYIFRFRPHGLPLFPKISFGNWA